MRKKKSGATIDVSLWSAPIYNDRHEIIGLIAFFEAFRNSRDRIMAMALVHGHRQFGRRYNHSHKLPGSIPCIVLYRFVL